MRRNRNVKDDGHLIALREGSACYIYRGRAMARVSWIDPKAANEITRVPFIYKPVWEIGLVNIYSQIIKINVSLTKSNQINAIFIIYLSRRMCEIVVKIQIFKL